MGPGPIFNRTDPDRVPCPAGYSHARTHAAPVADLRPGALPCPAPIVTPALLMIGPGVADTLPGADHRTGPAGAPTPTPTRGRWTPKKLEAPSVEVRGREVLALAVREAIASEVSRGTTDRGGRIGGELVWPTIEVFDTGFHRVYSCHNEGTGADPHES